jgi:ATP-dependent helicase/nuclease subunit B
VAATHAAEPGRPAFERLRAVIAAAKDGRPLAPVTVAVPSGYAALSARRLLASGALGPLVDGGARGLANTRFMALDRVAELLAAPALAAAGRRPLSPAIRAEAVRGALLADPGVFSVAATHPATERSLDLAFAELRTCTPDVLDRLAATGRKGADVVRLYRSWRRRLEGDWYDEHDVFDAAAVSVRAGTADMADVGHVVVFLPRRLPAPARRFVDALGPGATIVDATDVEPAALAAPAWGTTRVVLVTDPDEEARAAVRGVAERMAAGVPLHRIAMFHPPSGAYHRLLAHHLDAAGLPWNGPATTTLAESVAGRALLGLLDLPETGWRRGDVIAWLSSAPIVDTSLAAGGARRLVPAATWDTLSRRAGVIAGLPQWDERLEHHAAQLAAERDNADPDEDEWRQQRRSARLDAVIRLRTFVGELVALVEQPPAAGSTWSELAAWAIGLLDRYVGAEASWTRWPERDQESGAAVRAAVGSLASLDALGLSADPTTFRRALDRALGAAAGRSARFGDGVFLAPISLAAGIDVDVVFVVGLAEGSLPGRERDDPVIPARERLAAGGDLAETRTRLEDEGRDVVFAMTSAAHERVLSLPRADLRQRRARIPSRWLLQVVSALAGRPVYSGDLADVVSTDPDAILRTIPSHQAGLAAATEPASLHDRDIRDLLDWVQRRGEPARHPIAHAIPSLGRGFACDSARRSRAFTPFDGRLPADTVRLPGEAEPLSPTSLEGYAYCPRRYLFSRVLRVAALEKPEEILRISALDKGSLIHEVLERYVLGLLDGRARSVDDLLAVADDVATEYEGRGLTGKPLWWRYDRNVLRRDLERFFDEDDATPLAAELAFGMDGDPPVTVQVGGRTIAFRGMADRIDDDGAGGLVVTDYKTGSAGPYKGLDLDGADRVDRGRRLQLPIYGLAVRDRYGPTRPVHARYWFVTGKGGFADIGYDLDDDAMARFTDVVGTIADGITAGCFPGRPGDADPRSGWVNCRWCDYNSICPRDRGRQWERKRHAPELADYVELAEAEE